MSKLLNALLFIQAVFGLHFFWSENSSPVVIPTVRLDKSESLFLDILRLNPTVDKPWAKKLAESLHKNRHIINTSRALAIAKVESGINNRIRFSGKKATDYGVFQVHVKTIKDYNLEKSRLIYDVNYAVESYVRIMTDKKKECADRRYPWACYHSRTKKLHNIYAGKVNRVEI